MRVTEHAPIRLCYSVTMSFFYYEKCEQTEQFFLQKQLFGWKVAYWVTLGVATITTIIYFCFSSAERQEFDYQEGEDRVQSSPHA